MTKASVQAVSMKNSTSSGNKQKAQTGNEREWKESKNNTKQEHFLWPDELILIRVFEKATTWKKDERESLFVSFVFDKFLCRRKQYQILFREKSNAY